VTISQKIVLAAGAVAILLMVLFPPWYFVYDFPGVSRAAYRPAKPPYYATRFAGYHLITESNRPTDQTYLMQVFGLQPDETDLRYFSARIDKDRLWLQLAGAVAITVLLCVLFKGRKDRD
jgi:hypothetical protein